MSSFHNAREVHNQVANQHVHGDVHHHHSACDTQGPSSSHRQNDSRAEKSLDAEILASLAFPEMFYRRDGISSPHRTTCKWIFDLDEYRVWSTQTSGLLWVKRKPGAGKSTLMAHLYRASRENRLRGTDQTLYLDFFFTARGTLLQQTSLGMFRSLLNQIFSQGIGIRDIVRSPYSEKKQSFGSSQSRCDWQESELRRLLTMTVLASAQHQPVSIFIDALDETGEETARDLACFFHDLNDQLRLSEPTRRAKIQ